MTILDIILSEHGVSEEWKMLKNARGELSVLKKNKLSRVRSCRKINNEIIFVEWPYIL